MRQPVNQVPYLRNQRAFPKDPKMLSIELNKAYVDIALSINDRTIGLFPENRPSVTGNKWIRDGVNPQQTLRQVYPITSTTTFDHGLAGEDFETFVQAYGVYTDGTNWYSFVPGSNTAIAGQIGFYMTATQVVFTSGAGAPTLTAGNIVLEWLSFN